MKNVVKDVGISRSIEELATHAGMAFFANTGPIGAICNDCAWYTKGGCALFHKMTGKRGDRFPAGTSACKYFDPERRHVVISHKRTQFSLI